MAVTAGALTKVSASQTTASLSSAAATAGTGPYTYQWYRSTDPAFVPGVGNIIAGATSLTLNDSGLSPGTQYTYQVLATDTCDGNATDTCDGLTIGTSAAGPNPNQFSQSPMLGQTDLPFNYNTKTVMIDSSEVGTLKPGQAVKAVDASSGVLKVVAC